MKKIIAIFRSLLCRAPLVRAINVAAAPAIHRLTDAINVAFDPKAEWSVLKYGVYPNQVGLQVFDKEAATRIYEAFNSKLDRLADAFRGLPSYVGHPDDPEWKRANPNVPAAAVGRIKEMKVDDDGLRFRVAYNDEGKRLIVGDAPTYDSYSPNWGMVETSHKGRKAFRPVELYSIGFTNQPNIPGTFIGLNEALPRETTTMNEHLIKLLAALGITLAADATDAQATAAINEALPKATAAVADQGKLALAINEVGTLKPKVTALEAQVQTAVNESTTLRTSLATERSARAGLLITTAINEGRLTEAGRAEWLGKFTAQGASFDTVSADLGKLTKAVNTKSQTSDLGTRRGATGDQSKVRAVNDAIAAKKVATPGITHMDAWNAVRAEKPELFTNDKA